MEKESYEIIEKKLQLAELTIALGRVTRQKWANHEYTADILRKEEALIKQIAELSESLDKP